MPKNNLDYSKYKFKIVEDIEDENLFNMFNDEYTVYVKPGVYAMSSRKLETLIEIAYIQRYYQCNPVRFIDDFFNIELLDAQAYIVQRTWNCPNVLVLASRGFGKSTVIDLIVMAKDMLFCNIWTYIASGTGGQAEQTFTKLEQIANDNIDEMKGSTGYIFKNEVEINNAAGDGFSHGNTGFKYSLYNGSFTQTLNSNIDAKRGRTLIACTEQFYKLFKYSKGERIMITIRNYTNEELEYIQNNYNSMSIKELSNKLNKSEGSIGNAARKMGLTKQVHNKWTDLENKYLIENYCVKTAEEIATYLSRTTVSIFAQADRLGLMKQINWTNEDIEFLKTNFDQLSHAELGKILNRTQGAITAKCFDLGLYKKETPWDEWEIDFLKESYMEMCTADISRLLNRTESAVGLKASRLGLKKYPYYCNYHFFDDINTEDKAYWLGFLIADGWINKSKKSGSGVVGVELQYGDINHLKKMNKSLGGNYQIVDRWKECKLHGSNEKHHMCMLRIFSLTMYDALYNLGFVDDKSYNCFVPNIDPTLIRHFIRGYFDGDGCFCCTNKSFHIRFCTASERLGNDIIDILAKENIPLIRSSYINSYGTQMYEPFISRNEDKIKFLNYIYKDSTIHLDRKYKKYLKALEKYNHQ